MKKFTQKLLITSSLLAVSFNAAYATDVADGCKSVPRSNFTPKELVIARGFAELPYMAFEADRGNKVNEYNSKVSGLATDGWKVDEFKGTTGHNLLVNWFEKESTIGVFAENDNKLVISFRGTKTLNDWITNVTLLNGWGQKSRFLGEEKGGVHAGYYKVFKSFQDAVTNRALQAMKDGKNIEVDGHSMGGALAQLTVAYLKKLALENGCGVDIKAVTFDAPRVGSPNFVQKVNESVGAENVARVTKGDRELVASVVPGFVGFEHVGINHVAPNDGKIAPLANHKLGAIKSEELVAAKLQHDANPVKKLGVREKIAETKVGSAVFSAARSVKNNVINPVVNLVKGTVDAAKNTEGDFGAKVRAAGNYILDSAKSAGEKAKAGFVNGFQKARSTVAGWFGY